MSRDVTVSIACCYTGSCGSWLGVVLNALNTKARGRPNVGLCCSRFNNAAAKRPPSIARLSAPTGVMPRVADGYLETSGGSGAA